MRLSWTGALVFVSMLLMPGAALADAAMDRLVAALDEHGTVMQAEQASQFVRTFKLPTTPDHLAMKEVAEPDTKANQRRFAIVRRKKGSDAATIIFTWADAAQGWFMLSDHNGRLIQAIYSRGGGSGRVVSADDPVARRAFEEPARKGDSEKPEAPTPQKSEKGAPPNEQPGQNATSAPQADRQKRPSGSDDQDSFWKQDE